MSLDGNAVLLQIGARLSAARLSWVPLGRFGEPSADVAPVVAFLLSDDSAY